MSSFHKFLLISFLHSDCLDIASLLTETELPLDTDTETDVFFSVFLLFLDISAKCRANVSGWFVHGF